MEWEMEWGVGTIWDAVWVFGIFAVLFYAMYTRAVGDSIPADVISTSNPDERHESAI